MEPIRESTPERRMARALAVIEGVCLGNDDIISEMVFCLAHAGLGTCCAGGNGDLWLGSIERLEAELKAAHVIDVEQAILPKSKRSHSIPSIAKG